MPKTYQLIADGNAASEDMTDLEYYAVGYEGIEKLSTQVNSGPYKTWAQLTFMGADEVPRLCFHLNCERCAAMKARQYDREIDCC